MIQQKNWVVYLVVFFGFFLARLPAVQAISFSGNVSTDFPDAFCLDDPDGKNIAFPSSFPAGSVSGFDIEKICLLYDLTIDTLFVGAKTFENGAGNPVIFGDADGDGFAGSAGPALTASGGNDHSNLATEEFFALLFNLDNDATTAPDFIAGLSAERSAPLGLRVSEVSLPHLGEAFAFFSGYYGVTLASSSDSLMHVSPTQAEPHLEFSIARVSDLPGIGSLDLSNPDATISVIFKAGSLGDTGLGEEDIALTLSLVDFIDSDGDNIPNVADPDQDNDGIPDITEQNLDGFDTDGDGLLDTDEVAASGLDSDADGDLDVNDGIIFPNIDGDLLFDYLDSDTDGDMILDIDEADTAIFDINDNSVIDPDEYDDIDKGNNYSGGDNSGALKNSELTDSDADGTPDYRDTDSDNDGLLDVQEVGDTVLATIPYDTDGDGIPNFRDNDSDDDGIFDSIEAGDDDPSTDPVDSDSDGIPDFLDTDSDNDGVNDSEEVEVGTDPTNPLDSEGEDTSGGTDGSGTDDSTGDSTGDSGTTTSASSADEIQVQGSGLGSCALNRSRTLPPLFWWLCIPLTLIFFWRKQARYVFFSLICFLALLRPAHALNVEQLKTNFDHSGLFNLYGSQPLSKFHLKLGLDFDYAHQPVELGVVGTGRRVDPLVDYQFLTQLDLAFGLTETMTLGAWVPFFPSLSIQPIGTTTASTKTAIGDIGVGLKINLLDWQQAEKELGLALIPFLTLPTGSTTNFTGDATITAGFRTALDYSLGKNRFITNVGLRFRETESLLNLTVGQEMLYGLGYARTLLEEMDFHGLLEYSGSLAFNGSFTGANRAPMELLFGLKKGFDDSRFHVTLGSSIGLTTGYGTPDFRVFSLLDYVPRLFWANRKKYDAKTSDPELAQIKGEQIVILQPIHFETNRWTILPISEPVVESVARLLQAKPEIRSVSIRGHTDNRGSPSHNLSLSQNRANQVLQELINLGVEAERLEAQGFGESQPSSTGSSADAMAENRRVEFHITKMTQPVSGATSRASGTRPEEL